MSLEWSKQPFINAQNMILYILGCIGALLIYLTGGDAGMIIRRFSWKKCLPDSYNHEKNLDNIRFSIFK